MKFIRQFWIFILTATIILLSLYFVNFNVVHIPLFSEKQQDWASFGSYIGGTLGSLLAFLAYLGIREQLSEQRDSIKKQAQDKAFDEHVIRIKESLERTNQLSIESMLPIEKHLGIELAFCLDSELQKVSAQAEPIYILDDVIHASRLIQSAEYIFRRYLYLIEQSAKDLSEACPLDEHRWSAVVTWRLFQKRAKLLNYLALKAEQELLAPNPEVYKHEYQEILMTLCSGLMIPDTKLGGKVSTINEVLHDKTTTTYIFC